MALSEISNFMTGVRFLPPAPILEERTMKKVLLTSLTALLLSGCLTDNDSEVAIGTHYRPLPKETRPVLQPILGPCQEYAGNSGALEACKRGIEDRKKGEQILIEAEAYEKGRGSPR